PLALDRRAPARGILRTKMSKVGLKPGRNLVPARVRALVRAIEEDDEVMVERLLVPSRPHRLLAPLAPLVGAVALPRGGSRLMLGSKALLIPGIILLAIGATLQAGTTGAVRAIKMSTRLTGEHPHEVPLAPGPET